MPTQHIPKDLLLLFAQGGLEGETRRAVVRHLLTFCEDCRRTLHALEAEVVSDLEQPEPAHTASPGLLKSERAEAPRLWHELEGLPSSHRLLLARDDRRYHTRGFQEFLVERARAMTLDNTVHAAEICQLALEIVHRLPLDRYRRSDVADLRTTTLASLANCRRLLGDLDGAAEAIDQALDSIEWGTGDPLEEINVLSIYGSLLTDLGRIEEAVGILSTAARDAREIGDSHLEAKLLLQQSSTIGWYNPAAGLDLARKAQSLLPAHENPHLDLVARYQVMFMNCELGNISEARKQFEVWRFFLREQRNQGFWHSRSLQLEAALARREGRLEVCESFLRQLLDHYAERDLRHSMALTTLDLAEVLTAARKYEEALDLVQETLPVLRQWGASSAVLRACLTIQEAIEGRTLEAAVFREASQVVRRSCFRRY
jgi:tetratricopeptide (TPR) repeat protein